MHLQKPRVHPAVYRTVRLLWPGGLATRRHLQELERTQWLPEDTLHALQLSKLQQLVKHAYQEVPFYRERYRHAGIRPQDIRSLDDFEALPFLTREDVRDNLEALVATNYPRQRLSRNETGGSTGEPMRFFVEGSFWWWNAANVFRVRAWHGVREGDRIAWFWGAHRDMPDWSRRRRLRALLMQERYLNAFSMTEKKMHDFAVMLANWQPAMLKGYASALALFARYLETQELSAIRPGHIETTSEKLSGPQRELLERVFASRVADHYSCREMGTLAYQCQEGGFHICADVRYLEVVAGNQPTQPGQLGEVVVTSLNQFAMPFIRYKNGDMAIHDRNRCSCGRGLPLLQEVVGRTNDYLVAADGQFVHSEFFAYLFRVKPQVAQYQITQPDRDHLDVQLVCTCEVNDAWLDGVRAEIQDRFGPTTDISLRTVNHIALTPAGKHRYIISNVEPAFG